MTRGGSDTTFADSGTAACTSRVGHATLHGGELLAAKEQPRGGARCLGKGGGVGDEAPVMREIGWGLEDSHALRISPVLGIGNRFIPPTHARFGQNEYLEVHRREATPRAKELCWTDIDELMDAHDVGGEVRTARLHVVSGLLVDGDIALDRLALAAADGIGQVGRIAIEAGLGPERVAELGNRVQRYFVEETRLGIPAVIHEESTGGFCAREATQFPQGINLASTWDPALVERVAEVIGRQLRAVGARLTLAPVLDIARDARWGRLEETYGEDPELTSRIGVGYVRGIQSQGVSATAKHFLGYGAPEGGFNWGWSSMGPRHLRDVIAAPFRAVINEASVGAVMPSYNEIDGLPLHGSPELLTELLREELGFTGVTVADYFGVGSLEDFHHCADDEADAARLALLAGLDVELPSYWCYRKLPALVSSGAVPLEAVDASCRRVLAQKEQLGLFEQPYVDAAAAPAVFDTLEDRSLARLAASASIVLLANDGVLPLQPGVRISVLGPSADDPRLLLGDYHFPAHLELQHEEAVLSPVGSEFTRSRPRTRRRRRCRRSASGSRSSTTWSRPTWRSCASGAGAASPVRTPPVNSVMLQTCGSLPNSSPSLRRRPPVACLWWSSSSAAGPTPSTRSPRTPTRSSSAGCPVKKVATPWPTSSAVWWTPAAGSRSPCCTRWARLGCTPARITAVDEA